MCTVNKIHMHCRILPKHTQASQMEMTTLLALVMVGIKVIHVCAVVQSNLDYPKHVDHVEKLRVRKSQMFG
jgi:hypothetical protein